jgi:NADP-dependent 3-hydroxy acid dehydrogenase YdfG
VGLVEASVVLVTSGGVGGAEVLQLASEGPVVVVTGRRSTALVALAEQNPNVAFMAVDAAYGSRVLEAARHTRRALK